MDAGGRSPARIDGTKRRAWHRAGKFAVVLAAAVSGCSQRARLAEEPETPGPIHLLRPPPEAQIIGEVLEIVCQQGGRLARDGCVVDVDGVAVELAGVAPSFAVGAVRVDPGSHVLRLEGEERRFSVVRSPSATAFRQHPPPEAGTVTCGGCHRPGEELAAARDGVRCFGCHEEARFSSTHRHKVETLARCAECHRAHGGVGDGLLKDETRSLCDGCHES